MARIAGVDLPRNKQMSIALTYIYGIGPKIAKDVLTKAGLSLERIGELVSGTGTPVPPPPVRPGQVEVWSRVHIADGVELQIEPKRAGLSPEQLRDLVREIMAAYEHLQEEGG